MVDSLVQARTGVPLANLLQMSTKEAVLGQDSALNSIKKDPDHGSAGCHEQKWIPSVVDPITKLVDSRMQILVIPWTQDKKCG